MSNKKIAPSLMCTSFLNLKEELDLFVKHGIDYLHIDIMDGNYVPNFSLGFDFCRAVYSYTHIPLDIHLMIEKPQRYVENFSKFENAIISFHPETCYQPLLLIQEIKRHKKRAGIALSPSVSLEYYKHLIPYVDIVCVMTVHPGYAGQQLIEPALDGIKLVSGYIKERGLEIEIEVDGNVSWKNLPRMIEAGADIFVAGTSSIFEHGSKMEQNILRFKQILSESNHT